MLTPFLCIITVSLNKFNIGAAHDKLVLYINLDSSAMAESRTKCATCQCFLTNGRCRNCNANTSILAQSRRKCETCKCFLTNGKCSTCNHRYGQAGHISSASHNARNSKKRKVHSEDHQVETVGSTSEESDESSRNCKTGQGDQREQVPYDAVWIQTSTNKREVCQSCFKASRRESCKSEKNYWSA